MLVSRVKSLTVEAMAAVKREIDGVRAGPLLRAALPLVAAACWLSVLWNLPVDSQDLRPGFFIAVALEVILLFAALALIPVLRHGWIGFGVRHLIALATLVLVVLCLADLGVRMVLDRPLSPLLDLHIAPAVVNLLSGSLKGPIGWLAFAAMLLSAVLAYVLSAKAVEAAQKRLDHPPARYGALAVVVALLLTFVLGRIPIADEAALPDHLVNGRATTTVWHQWQRSREMLAALDEFEEVMAKDPFRSLPPERLLGHFADTDVLVVFFESYGRSALEQQRYSDLILPILSSFEATLKQKGLRSASSYLTSPTMGGQSWLAHGTFESGLWLAHQSYYDTLLASDRLTITKAFAKRGHRAVAMKPAIIFPWPEGKRFGFETIYAAADMGYAGEPYNWVTMPDQYTLSAFERFERDKKLGEGRETPLYAEFSLISSHAPWTHIPPVVEDWSSIGDGEIFSTWANDGDPPQVVWSDPERVRRQYAKSLVYVLNTLQSYVAEFVDENTLLIILGDHQPASLLTGEGVSRDVPIHVISGDPALLVPFTEWGFVPGMVPVEEAPVQRMDEFRDWFMAIFSD